MKLNKVHEDSRRTIHAVEGLFKDGAEFTFIHLKQGKAIGGCMHSKKEYYMVIKGHVLVRTSIPGLSGRNESKSSGRGGAFIPHEAHAFMAIEDSIICEWGISAEEKKSDKKDLQLLKFVNAVNKDV